MPGLSSEPSHPLGYRFGNVVQEFYHDDDCDEELRASLEQHLGQPLMDEEFGDLADGALIWWRAEDSAEEDLADLLVDALANLDNGGLVWVLTPKSGRPGHVPPADVEAAATTAGLHSTSAISAGPDWSGIRLIARGRMT
ncbi:MAG TPA: DUF3052 domain-containing protein [Actinomycetaceae bacterium]|nr:DUF3052 domain-containing protein [Actinomycetaceae bacterium]